MCCGPRRWWAFSQIKKEENKKYEGQKRACPHSSPRVPGFSQAVFRASGTIGNRKKEKKKKKREEKIALRSTLPSPLAVATLSFSRMGHANALLFGGKKKKGGEESVSQNVMLRSSSSLLAAVLIYLP